MKRNIQITIKGIQGNTALEEVTEIKVMGTYYQREDKCYIHYTDTSTYTEGEIKTIVKILPSKVMITRSGAIHTQMIFEKGAVHTCPYETPFGSFDVHIHTKDISFKNEEKYLMLEVSYGLEMNNMPEEEAYFGLHGRYFDEENIGL